MIRIHALTVDRGGCFHYRIRQPLTALRDLGAYTSWGSGVDFETWDAAHVLVTQYIHDSGDQWVKWCENSGKLCVWDADDDVFTTEQVIGQGTAYDDPGTLPKMRRAIAASHLVTVTTPRLAEIYSAINPNVVVLPNCIPDWLLEHDMPERPAGFTIGYSCSPSHQADIQAWAPTLAAHMRRYPSTRLRFWGPSRRPEGVPVSWPIEAYGWIKQTDAYLRALSADVGIAPLADLTFNAGKSGIKAQEYQGLGIVPVVQDVAQYRDVVRHGETGFLCRTKGQWLMALGQLAGDVDLREQMAAAGRRHARTFAQGRWAPAWLETYQKGLSEL